VQLGSRKLIVSVPYELNTDHTQVLAAAEVIAVAVVFLLVSFGDCLCVVFADVLC
jgi:hypothetical protein